MVSRRPAQYLLQASHWKSRSTASTMLVLSVDRGEARPLAAAASPATAGGAIVTVETLGAASSALLKVGLIARFGRPNRHRRQLLDHNLQVGPRLQPLVVTRANPARRRGWPSRLIRSA